VSALANPKSSTGRLDVFTRLIADNSDVFDNVPAATTGTLYRDFAVQLQHPRAPGIETSIKSDSPSNPANREDDEVHVVGHELRERHKTFTAGRWEIKS